MIPSLTNYNSNSENFRGNTKLFNTTIEAATGASVYAGGIVGQMADGQLTVSYSRVDVTILGASYAGGIIGLNKANAQFYELYSFGDVDAKNAGGLIGKNEANISLENCVAINFYSKTNSMFNETPENSHASLIAETSESVDVIAEVYVNRKIEYQSKTYTLLDISILCNTEGGRTFSTIICQA